MDLQDILDLNNEIIDEEILEEIKDSRLLLDLDESEDEGKHKNCIWYIAIIKGNYEVHLYLED